MLDCRAHVPACCSAPAPSRPGPRRRRPRRPGPSRFRALRRHPASPRLRPAADRGAAPLRRPEPPDSSLGVLPPAVSLPRPEPPAGDRAPDRRGPPRRPVPPGPRRSPRAGLHLGADLHPGAARPGHRAHAPRARGAGQPGAARRRARGPGGHHRGLRRPAAGGVAAMASPRGALRHPLLATGPGPRRHGVRGVRFPDGSGQPVHDRDAPGGGAVPRAAALDRAGGARGGPTGSGSRRGRRRGRSAVCPDPVALAPAPRRRGRVRQLGVHRGEELGGGLPRGRDHQSPGVAVGSGPRLGRRLPGLRLRPRRRVRPGALPPRPPSGKGRGPRILAVRSFRTGPVRLSRHPRRGGDRVRRVGTERPHSSGGGRRLVGRAGGLGLPSRGLAVPVGGERLPPAPPGQRRVVRRVAVDALQPRQPDPPGALRRAAPRGPLWPRGGPPRPDPGDAGAQAFPSARRAGPRRWAWSWRSSGAFGGGPARGPRSSPS